MVRTYGVDGDFFGMMGLSMSSGRALTGDPSDDRAAVINETAMRRMGWEEPLGKTITGYMRDLRVVGVVEDFHFDGPHKKVEPLLMAPVSNVGVIAVRAQPGHLDEVNELIDGKWAVLSPHRPIERKPLEEVFAGLYMEELLMGRALTVFLSFAIAVALVGLFGMAAHTAQNRTREIGVRKVFGASTAGLTAMMLRDFAKPVGLAFLLSVPIAWWLAGLWAAELRLPRAGRPRPVPDLGRPLLPRRRPDRGPPGDPGFLDQSGGDAAHGVDGGSARMDKNAGQLPDHRPPPPVERARLRGDQPLRAGRRPGPLPAGHPAGRPTSSRWATSTRTRTGSSACWAPPSGTAAGTHSRCRYSLDLPSRTSCPKSKKRSASPRADRHCSGRVRGRGSRREC